MKLQRLAKTHETDMETRQRARDMLEALDLDVDVNEDA